MKTFKEFLSERIVTIHPDLYDSHDEYNKAKHQFVKDHWDELQQSYSKMGGYSGAASPEELANDLHMIKGVRRNGKIVGWSGYRDKYGRKTTVSSTDGSDEGKKAYRDIAREDNLLKRSWAEKSGAPAKIADKMGIPKVPNTKAAKLTGKEIAKLHSDGTSYDRLIGTHFHTKTIYGHPKE